MISEVDDLQPFDAESYVYGLFADMIESNESVENTTEEVDEDERK